MKAKKAKNIGKTKQQDQKQTIEKFSPKEIRPEILHEHKTDPKISTPNKNQTASPETPNAEGRGGAEALGVGHGGGAAACGRQKPQPSIMFKH